MTSNDLIKKRKSKFNPSRENYLSEDGKFYCYLKWDGKKKKVVPARFEVGKDLPLELTVVLDELDYEEDLNERYENELKDPRFERKLKTFEDNLDSDEALDPWDTVADKVKSPEEEFFSEPEPMNPRATEVRFIIDEECTESQKNFVFDHFGMNRQLEEMRQEEISKTGKPISKQAFTNRKNKILDKVAKALGTERVKRCAVKAQD